MKRTVCLILAAALLLAACSGSGRVMSERRMIKVYTEMFLADQWLRDNPEYRKTADTTLFYESIFRHYGYSSEDFRTSLDYYMKRPDQWDRILRTVSQNLLDESERLSKEYRDSLAQAELQKADTTNTQ